MDGFQVTFEDKLDLTPTQVVEAPNGVEGVKNKDGLIFNFHFTTIFGPNPITLWTVDRPMVIIKFIYTYNSFPGFASTLDSFLIERVVSGVAAGSGTDGWLWKKTSLPSGELNIPSINIFEDFIANSVTHSYNPKLLRGEFNWKLDVGDRVTVFNPYADLKTAGLSFTFVCRVLGKGEYK